MSTLYPGRQPKLRPVEEIDPLYREPSPPRSDLADEDSSFCVPLDNHSTCRTWCAHCGSLTSHDQTVIYAKTLPKVEFSDRNRSAVLTCNHCKHSHGVSG